MTTAFYSTVDDRPARDDRAYFRTLATVMAVVQVAGFAVHLAMGRSSFGAPLIVHVHAVIFMGWVGIFALQPWLVNAGALGAHRLLGRVAVVWAGALLVVGVPVTWGAVHGGRTPFFFQPQQFLISDPMTIVAALVLLTAAVALRKRQDWHARLQIGSFICLMGPSFGRLLPMPFMGPFAFEIACSVPLVFVAAAGLRDLRVRKRVHPAWIWTTVVLAGALLLARAITYSPAGEALYQAAVAGTAAAGGDGLAFPPRPPGM